MRVQNSRKRTLDNVIIFFHFYLCNLTWNLAYKEKESQIIFNYMPHQPTFCFSHVILLINSPPMVEPHQSDDMHSCQLFSMFQQDFPHLFYFLHQFNLYSMILSKWYFFLTPYTKASLCCLQALASTAQFKHNLAST